MFHTTNDSHLFFTADQLRELGAHRSPTGWTLRQEVWLPLYEAKMAWMFDHRAADVVVSETALVRQSQPSPLSDHDHENADRTAQPRYWVRAEEIDKAVGGTGKYHIAFRRITASTNERTFVPLVLPWSATGDNSPLLNPSVPGRLETMLASFVVDFLVRQKLNSTTLNYFVVEQVPVLGPDVLEQRAPWSKGSANKWISERAVELIYTCWDLRGFAVDLGYRGGPFIWDRSRRELLSAELDAAFFHLYGIERDDVGYIMDTFPIVRRKDEAAHGEYRTKRLILERYDALAEAAANGTEYQTVLDPPPADPRVAHPESSRPSWA